MIISQPKTPMLVILYREYKQDKLKKKKSQDNHLEKLKKP